MPQTRTELRERLAAERKALADRYFAGDPNVRGGFFEEARPKPAASGNVVGRSRVVTELPPGAEVVENLTGDRTERYDWRTGQWEPE